MLWLVYAAYVVVALTVAWYADDYARRGKHRK